jgi:hypothetical protein
MSDEAKVTMLLYSDLSPDEQRKLESLDNAIASTLIEAGEKAVPSGRRPLTMASAFSGYAWAKRRSWR